MAIETGRLCAQESWFLKMTAGRCPYKKEDGMDMSSREEGGQIPHPQNLNLGSRQTGDLKPDSWAGHLWHSNNVERHRTGLESWRSDHQQLKPRERLPTAWGHGSSDWTSCPQEALTAAVRMLSHISGNRINNGRVGLLHYSLISIKKNID